MRRVHYCVAASLDGYIAGLRGEYDWIPAEPAIDWAAFMQRFDTVLMGRGTYELVAGDSTGAAMPQMSTVVFSRTLKSAEHPKVTIVAHDAPAYVGALRQAPGKDIWLMGGGVLFASLLESDLVDVLEIGLSPVLLGQGLPLLPPMPRRTRLVLKHTHTYPSGIVMLTYDVRRDAG